MTYENAIVFGAGGFIGGHLVKRLESEGKFVVGVDIKPRNEWYQLPVFSDGTIDECDLRKSGNVYKALGQMSGPTEIYNLAADMGGMGYIELNKFNCMASVLINSNILKYLIDNRDRKFFKDLRYFYASSACVYADYKQDRPDIPALKEEDAYPAMPEDGYGWEKLFSERMCQAAREEFGLQTFIGRYHNVYGPHGTYEGGREKAPAAICRKVIQAASTGKYEIDIWGDGEQTRSFMYIDDCLEGTTRLIRSDFPDPINIGSAEMVTINQLVGLAEKFAGVKLERSYDLSAPQGVKGRNSDNTLIKKVFDWEPSTPLEDGLRITYEWIRYKMMFG